MTARTPRHAAAHIGVAPPHLWRDAGLWWCDWCGLCCVNACAGTAWQSRMAVARAEPAGPCTVVPEADRERA